MVIDELMLYLKEILLGGSHKITPMIIERFFRVLAESKSLLSLGSDGEFVLSLTLFKMMEALQIKDIDSMIRSLEKELSGVEVKKEEITRLKPSVPSVPMVEEALVQKRVEAPKVIEKSLDAGGKLFEALIVKMYDRNYELGECFKHSIEYNSFNENILTWESSASSEQKILLRNNWGMIRMFAQEIFGFETKIKNISKELPSSLKETKPILNEIREAFVEPISMIEDEILNQPMFQEVIPEAPFSEELMKSSCVAPSHGGVESAKEKDERTILDEPMVAKALELFAPKKVRVKRKG
jgi:DNA polymerase-3 subunit gamma/tau